jgi:hypothetical protein
LVTDGSVPSRLAVCRPHHVRFRPTADVQDEPAATAAARRSPAAALMDDICG